MMKEIEREGVKFTIGKGGDFSDEEVEFLKLQIQRWNAHNPEKKLKKISVEMLRGVLEVKRAFPGATIENWRKR